MSIVWEFFQISNDDASKARCSICGNTYSRGSGAAKSFSTSNLMDHLKAKHSTQLDAAQEHLQKEKEKTKKDNEKRSIHELNDLTDDVDNNLVTKQSKVDDFFKTGQKFAANNQVQQKLSFELAEWIFSAGLPYTTVEDERFRVLMENLNPKFRVPTEAQLRRNLMPEIYSRIKLKLIELLANQMDVCSLTTDMWTSSAMDAYMSLTVHYIDKKTWERKVAILECIPFPEKHSAENLAISIKKILNEFKIKKVHLVVRDNGLNVVNGVKLAGLNAVGCFLHALHLVVRNSLDCQRAVLDLIAKVRKIASTIRHSANAKQTLKNAQKAEKLPEHRLIIDQPTRWSSTYQMLERFLSQKKAIKLACVEIDKLTNKNLARHEWELLENLVKLLHIFAEAVTSYEKEDTCISEELVELKILLRKLREFEASGLGTLREELIQKIEQYFFGNDKRAHFESIENKEFYTVATLLDPRFKKKPFRNQEIADKAEIRLVTLVANEITSVQDVELLPSSKRSCLEKKGTGASRYAAIDSSSEDSGTENGNKTKTQSGSAYEIAKAMVSDYLAEKRIDVDESPLPYWKSQVEKRPEMAKLAMQYLSAPISSVTSEREFKTARDLANGNRTRLLPGNVQKLLFIKHNLKAVGFNTYRLKSEAVEPYKSDSDSASSDMEMEDEEIADDN